MNELETIDIRTGKPFTGLQKTREHGSIPGESIEGNWGRSRGLLGGAFMGAMLAQQSGGWVNPYVTNGLVWHIDGEWNAGGGSHDSAATSWTDLSGNGYDITGLLASGWSDKSYHQSAYNSNSSVTFPKVAAAYLSQNITIEYVVDRTTYGTQTPIQNLIYTSGVQDAGSAGSFNSSIFASFRSGTSATHQDSMQLSDIRRRFAVSFRLNGLSSAQLVYNGGSAPSGTFKRSGWQAAAAETQHPFNSSSSSFWRGGEIHAIRIYNRQLTAAEIAANYAVDKARFNLP